MPMEALKRDRMRLDTVPNRIEKMLPEVGLVQRSQNVSVELVPKLAIPMSQFQLNIPATMIMVAFEAGSAWEALGTDRLQKRSFRNRCHFLPTQAEIHIRIDQSAPEFLLLGINTEFARQVFEEISECRSAIPEPVIGEAPARLLSLGNILRGDLLKKRELKALELESLASLLLAEWSDDGVSTQLDSLSQKMVAMVKDFVEAHLDQDLSLTDLASIAELSPSYFLRTFKQATGQTPHRYVMESRVQRARERLERTDHPLADIAYDCGFASQSHMTDVFRSYVKMSPGRYRRSIRS